MSVLWVLFKNRWITPPAPFEGSFEGKTILVTGATSGIGLEAVVKFAAQGATKVIMTARDKQKGESTKSAIEKRLEKKVVLEVWELDMNSYESIVAFAERAKTLDSLDIAILNAGLHKVKYTQSGNGWEEDLQVNALSTTLLATLLLPTLLASKKKTGRTAVLEFVNSGLHETAKLPSKARQSENIIEFYNKPENFGASNQYSFTKLFQMFAVGILSKKVSAEDVIVTSICPGPVLTSIARDISFPGISLIKYIASLLAMHTPAIGANVILTGTAQGPASHGRFWNMGVIKPVAPTLAGVENEKLGEQVWREMVTVLAKEVRGVDVLGVVKGLDEVGV
ncbi:unnamed protein product [Periconia digitata]|uniref:NAD(P)-binding protein n=1 Tax=Periconia digitata TaxID=1303443 RepID=A0A9W4U3S2_9PLEO|nr:unnamed protein product [Periconia digitata]